MTTRAQAIAALTAPGEPYELTEVEQFGVMVRAFRNAPATLRAHFEAARSAETFVVYEDERYSFEETWQMASRVATILHEEFGVVHGDRVAISMRNYPEWIFAFMAVTSIGGIAVAMNAMWTPDEMEYGLVDSGAKVLFADAERVARLRQTSDALAQLRTVAVRCHGDIPAGVVELEALLPRYEFTQMPAAQVHPKDDATILYTSGSTGHPKGAVSCHRNIISALMSWELDGRSAALMAGIELPAPKSQPAALLAVPLFHATGSHAVFLASYRAQRRLIAMYKWDVAIAAEIIERERVTAFVAPAAMTGDLVVHAQSSNRDLSSLAMVGGGGAPRAPEQVRSIDKTFTNAMPSTGWGMTETNAIGTGIGGADYLSHPESSGRSSAVLDLRIVAEDGTELPSGQRGELQVRGASVIRGYWKRPEANAETFTDRWLRTGDVAYLDEEGFLYIVDRIKDLVIRGGENIGCGSVEAALLEHPRVLEASVYGVPDDRLGEEVAATVYIDGDVDGDADETELRTFLRERLAAFEIPRYFHFAAEPLPRIASGKIFKRQLRDEAATRLAQG
jgi:long-chain acyl-CoA synthetase